MRQPIDRATALAREAASAASVALAASETAYHACVAASDAAYEAHKAALAVDERIPRALPIEAYFAALDLLRPANYLRDAAARFAKLAKAAADAV